MEILHHLMNKISQGLIEINDLRDRLMKIRDDKSITYQKKSIKAKQIEEEIELFLEFILSNEQLIYKIQAEESLKSQELKTNSPDNLTRNEMEINNNDNHLIILEKNNHSVYEDSQYPIISCEAKNEVSENTNSSIDIYNSNELNSDDDISTSDSSLTYNNDETAGRELPDIRKYFLDDKQLPTDSSSSEERIDENSGYDYTSKEERDNNIPDQIRDSYFNLGTKSEKDMYHVQEHNNESSSYGNIVSSDKFTLYQNIEKLQGEKKSEINSAKPHLNFILVQPGSSTTFINYFRTIMKNNVSKILTDHQITEIEVEWIPTVKEENTFLESDLLNDICKINTTLLSDAIQEIFNIVGEMYLKNEPMHKYAIEKNISIAECPMIPRASRNNRNIYFLYYKLLMCNNKKSFMEIYEKFEKLIIRELVNPILLEKPENNISKLSDQPYVLNRPCDLEKCYEKMGMLNDSNDYFSFEKNHNQIIIQAMLGDECQNEDILWNNFYEEELELYEESTENTSNNAFKDCNVSESESESDSEDESDGESVKASAEGSVG